MAKDFNEFLGLLDSNESYNDKFDAARKAVHDADSHIAMETKPGFNPKPVEARIKKAYEEGKVVSTHLLRAYHEWING